MTRGFIGRAAGFRCNRGAVPIPLTTLARLLCGWFLWAWAGTAHLHAQLPPDVAWQTLRTEHFRVHFTPEIEQTARRAAASAERAYDLLSTQFVRPPTGDIDLLVADNVDFANGYATPFPRNRIVIYAHPPTDEPTLSFFDDWVELVVTHELTHIFHLDYGAGIWKPLRTVFGRSPLLFPQVFSPSWITEGLATYFESELTRSGRVRGTQHEMVLRTAILEDRFFDIGRATGNPISWPGEATRYVYGSLFLTHLAEQYGPRAAGEYVRALGGQLVPYRLNSAGRSSFGVSFNRAWRDWEADLRARYAALADSLRTAGLSEPELLTRGGRFAVFPRYAPRGDTIAYSAATGREELALRLILPDGSEQRIAPTHTLGAAAWMPGGRSLLKGELQFIDPYRIYSDAYLLALDGERERVTNGARIWELDPHPDGRTAVGVGNANGSNVLVRVDLQTGAHEPLVSPSPDVHWSLPRWSPDGSRIAAARWETGGYFDIVVLDATGALVRQVTRDRAVDGSPAWSPDGRYVVFASDRTGISNLYAFDTVDGSLLQVTNVLSGAFQPDVSADGRWIAFAFYAADGYHIARIPFEPATWRPAPPVRREVQPEADAGTLRVEAAGPVRPYSPWRTLAPAAWEVIAAGDGELGVRLGAAVYGEDVVGRHQYRADAAVHTNGARLNGGASYRYRGFGNPVVDIAASQEWLLAARAGAIRDTADNPIPTALFRRDRRAGVGATLLRRRWRASQWLGLGGEIREFHFAWDEPERGVRLRETPLQVGASAEVGHSSARGYTYSISPEDGVVAVGRLQGYRYTEPVGRNNDMRGYVRATARGRGFRGFEVAGFARHVLAGRVDVGVETGSLSPGFAVGGTSSGGLPFGFGTSFSGGGGDFPVRGYAEGAQFGDRALSATIEYRLPLFLPQTGVGTLPFFLDRLSADVFADAGTAWCSDRCGPALTTSPAQPDPLVSVGAEVLAAVKVGYLYELVLRGGLAVPLTAVDVDGAKARPGLQPYFALGRSF